MEYAPEEGWEGEKRNLNTFPGDEALHATEPGPAPPPALPTHTIPAEPQGSVEPPPFSFSAEPHPHDTLHEVSQTTRLRSPLAYADTLSSPNFPSTEVWLPQSEWTPEIAAANGSPPAPSHWPTKFLYPSQSQLVGSGSPEDSRPNQNISESKTTSHNSTGSFRPSYEWREKETTQAPRRQKPTTRQFDPDKDSVGSLACPFWKKDPRQAWSRSRACCKGHSRIRDVKQHLKRRHKDLAKIQCLELGQYSKRNAGEMEQWFAIWDIVFPNLPRPPSPYVSDDLQAELSEYQSSSLSQAGGGGSDNTSGQSSATPATPLENEIEVAYNPTRWIGELPWVGYSDSLGYDQFTLDSLLDTSDMSLGQDIASWGYDMGDNSVNITPHSWGNTARDWAFSSPLPYQILAPN